ncbi:class I SAM-dependent methyltransferase [Bacillus sp. H-16]|uniref:class I SAM-dependent methyltransferase n=1 Tax=Alteribacter salitolerans TaxID=2912333 RepID=UPI001966AAEC|nr:class I SAM-dependent methyltransferase [Alteribacter salitolerans]MBM7096352.1 class I SAM-dependent methyltransferase [Alteribacter salitolerans]
MKTLEGVLPFTRLLLEKAVPDGGTAVDATAGNGHDTLFLAKLVGETGRVFSFDIQDAAIDSTGKRLKAATKLNLKDRVSLIKDSHEHVLNYLGEPALVHGAVFNLGYLPGSDKSVTTTPSSTIRAVESLFSALAPGGVIVLVVYHGHEEGKIERDALLDYVRAIPQEEAHVLEYRFTNQRNNPPFIVAIEKRA